MQRVYRARSYEASVEIFMERLNIDVWTIESKDNGQEALPHLAKYRDSDRVKIRSAWSPIATWQLIHPTR